MCPPPGCCGSMAVHAHPREKSGRPHTEMQTLVSLAVTLPECFIVFSLLICIFSFFCKGHVLLAQLKKQ